MTALLRLTSALFWFQWTRLNKCPTSLTERSSSTREQWVKLVTVCRRVVGSSCHWPQPCVSAGPVREPSSHLRPDRQHVQKHDDRRGESVCYYQVIAHVSFAPQARVCAAGVLVLHTVVLFLFSVHHSADLCSFWEYRSCYNVFTLFKTLFAKTFQIVKHADCCLWNLFSSKLLCLRSSYALSFRHPFATLIFDRFCYFSYFSTTLQHLADTLLLLVIRCFYPLARHFLCFASKQHFATLSYQSAT